MNRPATVIGYVNAAHFIDHYAMLVFPAALVFMAPVLGRDFSELLPYATPGFVAFGAGSLLTGWLGDRWSRRHMMVVFFFGIGLALVATGLAATPWQLGAALLAVGAFASIYHPVGSAMLVAHAGSQFGRQLGINGVCGNLGVALSALVTSVLGEYLGWRAAFVVPGVLAMAAGAGFALQVRDEPLPAQQARPGRAQIPASAMWRVLASLVVTVLASSTVFNAVTVTLPNLFAERLAALISNPALLGVVTAVVYVFGAAAQYTIGGLIDSKGLRSVFLPLSFVLAPAFFLAAHFGGAALLVVATLIVIALFGQVTINDAMVGRYTSDRWRARAYAARYFIGFTAAGGAVALVSAMHARGGFTLSLQVLGALSLLVIVGGLIFPRDRPRGQVEAA